MLIVEKILQNNISNKNYFMESMFLKKIISVTKNARDGSKIYSLSNEIK
jgi:hypothetical protein